MFASIQTFRPSNDAFAAIAVARLSHQVVFADVEGLVDAMSEQISGELFESFAFGEPDFSDYKHNRRAAYHCRGGRFGGDVGNRKRRSYHRYDRDFEHAQLLAAQLRDVRQVVEDGIDEFNSGEFRLRDIPNCSCGLKSRGELCGTTCSGESRCLSGSGPRIGDDRLQVVEQSRTGHLVVVAVLPKNCTRRQRQRALVSLARSLQRQAS